MNKLENRWTKLWLAAEALDDPVAIFHEVVKRYSESHRFYHNLEHIAHCLYEFDTVRSFADGPVSLELAIWFHDLVYDTRARDNEHKSALLAEKFMKPARIENRIIDKVKYLILLTTHDITPADLDGQLMVDIDLSSLGKPFEGFKEDGRKIRKEYEWVPKKEFLSKRCQILKSFLDRESMYYTEFFRDKFEENAKRNLTRSVEWMNY